MDIYKIITEEMNKRELEYISFPDLVDYIRSINKTKVQNSIIGDFLLLKLKRFNPYEYGADADFFAIYWFDDLSDVTREPQITYDQEVFFKFAYSLCDGSYKPENYHSSFLFRGFILGELGLNEECGETQTSENENLSKPDTIQQLQNEIARLQAEIERLKSTPQAVENSGNVTTFSEYEGELPLKTNADKLADFIELVFNPDLLDNGEMPTYSRLHTKLETRCRDRRIPSKNTIKKYLNQF